MVREMKDTKRNADLKEINFIRQTIIKKNLQKGSEPIFFIDVDEEKNALFLACKYIGFYSGITFVSPPSLFRKEANDLQLEEICRYSSVRSRNVILRENWWKEDGLPLLGFYGSEKQPVALVSITPGSYTLIDPLTGKKSPIDKELATAIAFKAHSFFSPSLSKLSLLKLGRTFLKVNRSLLFSFLFTAFFGIAMGLLNPVLTGLLFDRVIPDNDYTTLYQITFGLTMMAVSIFCFQLSRSLVLLRMSILFQHEMTAAIWDRLLRLPLQFFKQHSVGDLIQRVNFMDAFSKVLGENAINLIVSAGFSFVYLIPMFYYSWQMSIIGLFTLFLISVLTLTCFKWQANLYSQLLKISSKINQFLFQIVNGIAKIRVAGAEKRVFLKWAEDFVDSQQLNYRLRNLQIFVDITTTILSSLFFLGIYSVGFYLLQTANQISIGSFMAFIAAFTPLLQATSILLSSILSLSILQPYWQRTQIIFDTPIEAESLSKQSVPQLKGAIKIENLYFRYQQEQRYLLQNVNLLIQPGEFIGIIGPSGGGKTSLLKLLLEFEKPEKGEIFYDNKTMGSLNIEECRRQIGTVLQFPSIIFGTILENIVCGRKYSSEQLKKALRISGLEMALPLFPMGLHTMLTTGGNTLSGGQKQRIALARALLLEPKILFLDEATSALDNQSQEQLISDIYQLPITKIVIAHRLNVLTKADQVFSIENNTIRKIK